MAAFSELSFAIRRQGMLYPEASTTSNSNESNVKLLTTAAMVENLAKKVGVSAKSGSLSIVRVQLGPRKLPVIRSSGMSAIQGLLKIEVNGGQSGLSESSVYRGCPLLRGVRYQRVGRLSM